MIYKLIVMVVLAYVQNMTFTWSSRSRNSGDPSYHRWAAMCSNSVFFATNGLMFWALYPIVKGEAVWWWAPIFGVAYTLATTEGSVFMMRRLIRKETGKRKVGA